MNKIDEFIDSLVHYHEHLRLTIKNENLRFLEFNRFFDQKFNELSKLEQDRLMTMLERNNKLKKLLDDE